MKTLYNVIVVEDVVKKSMYKSVCNRCKIESVRLKVITVYNFLQIYESVLHPSDPSFCFVCRVLNGYHSV